MKFGKTYFFCKKWKKNGKKIQKIEKNGKKCDFRIFGFLGKNRTFWEKIGLFGPFFRGILEHFERICPKYT